MKSVNAKTHGRKINTRNTYWSKNEGDKITKLMPPTWLQKTCLHRVKIMENGYFSIVHTFTPFKYLTYFRLNIVFLYIPIRNVYQTVYYSIEYSIICILLYIYYIFSSIAQVVTGPPSIEELRSRLGEWEERQIGDV